MSLLAYTYVYSASGAALDYEGVPIIWGAVELQTFEAGLSLEPYSREDYAQALASLLPDGPAWSREPQGALMRLLSAFAAEMARVDQRMAVLLAETNAATAAELLSDWERVVGLPDPCVPGLPTIAERRQALLGRLLGGGGQSRGYFIALASRLGFNVTIDEFASATAATLAGVSFTGSQWAHIWRVNSSQPVAISAFRVGSGAAGEPLRKWGNEVLECQINRFKPAHTQVLFAYPT